MNQLRNGQQLIVWIQLMRGRDNPHDIENYIFNMSDREFNAAIGLVGNAQIKDKLKEKEKEK